MRRIYLPLFGKFSIAIITMVLIYGSINISLIWTYAQRGLDSELKNRLELYAKSWAHVVSLPISDKPNDIPLQEILQAAIAADSLIAYMIYVSSGKEFIVAGVNKDIPKLPENSPLNNLPHYQEFAIPDFENRPILDIAVPIDKNATGMMRVGMFQDQIPNQMIGIIKPYIIMVLTFLAIGILGALFFSFVITTRVKVISQITENFNFQNLKNGKIPKIKKSKWLPYVNLFQVDDELDKLIYQINSMIDRLEKAYSELEQTYARFVQTEKLASLGVLSAGVAHEINNPVAGIQNCIRRIKNHPKDVEKNSEYIRLIEDAVNKTQNVVGRLLDYARSPRSVDQAIAPDTAIEKALLLVSYRLEKSRISVIKNIPHNISPIWVNQNELEQIFVNLLLNGIDAIDEHTEQHPNCDKLIRIDMLNIQSNVQIKISDTGIGMTLSQQAKMFDPFYTTKDTGKGTGLGMYVVYNLVHSNNGHIHCESEKFKGTTFTLDFLTA